MGPSRCSAARMIMGLLLTRSVAGATLLMRVVLEVLRDP